MKKHRILTFSLVSAMAIGYLPLVAYAENNDASHSGTTSGQPFLSGTGGSWKFRIPCLATLDDGTIVAAADARWNGGGDAGGIDTMVSYSTDLGENWHYSFANYLGDNGDTFNRNSTAFIDPALATDGEDLYMIADLYPAGYAINTAPHQPLYHFVGQDKDGNLLLAKMDSSWHDCWDAKRGDKNNYTYTLKAKKNASHDDYYEIVETASGKAVEGYTIDGQFNIKGKNVDTNLFISDSPFQVWPNDYLYFTKSSDKGVTWSDPMLLNMRREDEQSLLVGPGRGTYTSDGKLIFTSYEWTGRDVNSSLLISEDKGKTWVRGGDTPDQTSESVMCEADGRYYLFTRHGGYYTSEDGGMTWSSKHDMGISYNHNCQLTAVTYPEKIDGRTAIIFACPSSTSARMAGKIFVGLVQDDGSLDWKYNYSINGDSYYAYSCLAVLENGDLGLLYENEGTSIRYMTIDIDDVVPNGVIGDIWCTDADGVVKTVSMKSNSQMDLSVHGLVTGETTVVSSDPSITASLQGDQLHLQSGAVTGLKQVNVTLENGGHRCVLQVNVSDSEQYQIVDLKVGESMTIVDDSGDYGNADVSALDQNIAGIALEGESGAVAERSVGVLKSADKVFEGEQKALEDLAFTFHKTAENTYTIRAQVGADTVYMNHKKASAPGIVCTKAETNIKLTQKGDGVDFEDLTAGTAGKYLYFHRTDQAGKQYRYDRNGTSADECKFYLFVKDAAATDSGIIGYRKLADLTEIKNDEKYLIVAEAGGSYYVLNPSLSNDPYDYVAKIMTTSVPVKEETAVQLGDDATFAGAETGISDCAFTFTKSGENYHVSAVTPDNRTAYLSFRTSSAPNQPLTETAGEIKLTDDHGKVILEQVNGTNGKYLYFWSSNDKHCYFDRNSGINENTKFELFVEEAGVTDSGIQGYKKVSANEVVNGGKYLIAYKIGDIYYVMHPSLDDNKFHYTAKVTNETYVPEETIARTTITFTGKMNGSTAVKIGNTDYFVNVRNDVKNINLQVGESYRITGEILAENGDASVVTKAESSMAAPYRAVSEITNGQYLIGNSSHIITTTPGNDGSTKGLVMRAADFERGDLKDQLFTVTKTENGKYTIQSSDGKYINFTANHSVELQDRKAEVEFVKKNGGFAIKAGSNYLNNFRGSNTLAATWGSDDNTWSCYTPSKGTMLTALHAGTVTYVTAGVDYVVTVAEEPIIMHTLTVQYDSKMGNVTKNVEGTEFAAGTKVELTVVPNKGYHFVEWKVGDKTSKDAALVVTMDQDVTVSAVFASDEPESVPTVSPEPSSSPKPTPVTTPMASLTPAKPVKPAVPEKEETHKEDQKPTTGDTRNVMPWTFTILAAALGAVVLKK